MTGRGEAAHAPGAPPHHPLPPSVIDHGMHTQPPPAPTRAPRRTPTPGGRLPGTPGEHLAGSAGLPTQSLGKVKNRDGDGWTIER
eukprot:gene13962-13431_t